ncbi:MAG: ATP-binding protein [Anaerolineales bacterium]
MTRETIKISRFSSRLRRLLHSFRFRLTLLFVAILAVILAVFSVFIYNRQRQIVYVETENSLSRLSSQLVAYYSSQLTSQEEEDEEQTAPIPQSDVPLLQDDAIFALVDLDGKVALQQGAAQSDVLTAMIATWNKSKQILEPINFNVPGSDNQGSTATKAYLFELSPLQVEHGWGGFILLALPIDPDEQLARLALSLILSTMVILLIAFAGGYWLANRAMTPVQDIVHTAREISESDLNRRLNLQRNDEIGELADTFDRMLDRLQAAFKRQRQFTADASHELRSPLAIIELESNRALERRRTPEEYEKTLRLIQSENEWMSKLVNELLLLARLDADRTAMRVERLDLGEVVVDVIERLTPLAQARDVGLRTGSLDECYVRADYIFLSQMLANLIDNAIKYNDKSDAYVLIETTSKILDSQTWGIVAITDNGPGIPEDQLAHIFNRFYRMDKARVRQFDESDGLDSGSGLGLAIVKSIAEVFGGNIEVESRVGKGTVFTVWLPADL